MPEPGARRRISPGEGIGTTPLLGAKPATGRGARGSLIASEHHDEHTFRAATRGGGRLVDLNEPVALGGHAVGMTLAGGGVVRFAAGAFNGDELVHLPIPMFGQLAV